MGIFLPALDIRLFSWLTLIIYSVLRGGLCMPKKKLLERISEHDQEEITHRIPKTGRPTTSIGERRRKPRHPVLVEHKARALNDKGKHGDMKAMNISLPFPLVRALDILCAQRESPRSEILRQMLRLYLAQYCEDAVFQSLHEATLQSWPLSGKGLANPPDPMKIEFSKQAEQYRALITSYNFQYRLFRNYEGRPVLILGDEIYDLDRYTALDEDEQRTLLKKIVSEEMYERSSIGRGFKNG